MCPKMERYVDIAGCLVQVRAPAGVLNPEPGILTPFLRESGQADYELHMALLDTLPEPVGELLFSSPERRVRREGDSIYTWIGPETNPYLFLSRRGKRTDAMARSSAFAQPLGSRTILTSMEVEHLTAENHGLLFHSSFIESGGEAILFTAPSGVGKSTQAELWRVHRGARILNGDRSVIRIIGNEILALGVPFSGSSGICSRARLPIRAIVCLSQAGENRIERLRGARAFRLLWEGCSLHTWNRREAELCTETLTKVLTSVPVYHLACTPDIRAVETLERVLGKEHI